MTLYELTKSSVKDDSGKLSDPFDFETAITAALKRYSKHRPRLVTVDLPGIGSHDLALPDNWTPGFSIFSSVEYPIDRIPANLLESDLWQLYRSPSGQFLRILYTTIDAAEVVRCEYSLLHDETSLPESDLECVANLAASSCCYQLARAFSNTNDPTIQADVVNYRSKGDEYARRGKELEALYKNHLGIRDDDTVPAGMVTARPPERRGMSMLRR